MTQFHYKLNLQGTNKSMIYSWCYSALLICCSTLLTLLSCYFPFYFFCNVILNLLISIDCFHVKERKIKDKIGCIILHSLSKIMTIHSYNCNNYIEEETSKKEKSNLGWLSLCIAKQIGRNFQPLMNMSKSFFCISVGTMAWLRIRTIRSNQNLYSVSISFFLDTSL